MIAKLLAALIAGTLLLGAASPHKAAQQSIDAQLAGKTYKEKANIKGQEIANSNIHGTYHRGPYAIEIKSIEVIDGGVQLYIQASKNGHPVGFGADGTIETERFRIYNPPVLVDHPQGDIPRTQSDGTIRTLKEDPLEAVLQVLDHDLTLVAKDGSKIVSGSVGHTVDTFFSSANDGRVYRYATDATWAAARDTTNGTGATTADTSERGNFCDFGNDNPGKYDLARSFFDFNTAAIGTDNISAATFSFSKTGSGFSNTNSTSLEVVQTTHALPPTTSDFHSFTYTSGGSLSYSSLVSGYNDITLTSTGRSFINKTGTTKIGMICGRDLNNSAPTGANDPGAFFFADQTGTTNDPKLVVTHAVAAATFAPWQFMDF